MLTVTLLCAVFASFTIPPEWAASEMKNLEDRATVRISRQYNPAEKVTVPDGCYLVDEKTGLVLERPAPVEREHRHPFIMPTWPDNNLTITPAVPGR
jgi:hypothetical protein